MGYCTRVNRNGREEFVCDSCGRTGGVRRRRCPFGYCYRPALCGECHKRERWGTKARHRELGCDAKHAAFAAERKREAELLAAGVPVRCSALNAGTPEEPFRVHVLFRVQDCCGFEKTIGRYMLEAVYHARPIGEVATLADYEAANGGPLPEAPAEFHFGGATKRVG